MDRCRRNLPLYIVTGCLVFGQGCASRLYVKSNPPKAFVELVSLQQQNAVALGQTPLILTKEDFLKQQLRGPYLLRIRREGFETKEVLISSLSGLDAEISVELPVSLTSHEISQLINDLFAAQSLAQKGKIEDCLTQLNRLQIAHPEVSAIYEIRGSVELLSSRNAAAAEDFKHAMELDAANGDLKSLYETALKNAGTPPR